MAKIDVLKSSQFDGLNFCKSGSLSPLFLNNRCDTSSHRCRQSSRKYILLLAQSSALEGCRMTLAPSCWLSWLEQPAAEAALPSLSKNLQEVDEGRWRWLATEVCCCDQTYELQDFLIAICRLLNELDSTMLYQSFLLLPGICDCPFMCRWEVRLPTI